LDEVEHDSDNYQGRGLCYLPKPKAEADNTNRGHDTYRYHCEKPNPIFVLLYNLYKRKVNNSSSEMLANLAILKNFQKILLSVDIICRCDVATNDMRISCVFVANQK
jgi:hypothetical protein